MQSGEERMGGCRQSSMGGCRQAIASRSVLPAPLTGTWSDQEQAAPPLAAAAGPAGGTPLRLLPRQPALSACTSLWSFVILCCPVHPQLQASPPLAALPKFQPLPPANPARPTPIRWDCGVAGLVADSRSCGRRSQARAVAAG